MKENGVEEPLAIAFNGGNILQQIMGENWKTLLSVFMSILY